MQLCPVHKAGRGAGGQGDQKKQPWLLEPTAEWPPGVWSTFPHCPLVSHWFRDVLSSLCSSCHSFLLFLSLSQFLVTSLLYDKQANRVDMESGLCGNQEMETHQGSLHGPRTRAWPQDTLRAPWGPQRLYCR